jgi:ATP-dependent 26S proteasome regulatory subunit
MMEQLNQLDGFEPTKNIKVGVALATGLRSEIRAKIFR